MKSDKVGAEGNSLALEIASRSQRLTRREGIKTGEVEVVFGLTEERIMKLQTVGPSRVREREGKRVGREKRMPWLQMRFGCGRVPPFRSKPVGYLPAGWRDEAGPVCPGLCLTRDGL